MSESKVHMLKGIGKSKVNMPEGLKKKCHAAIHSATAAAAAAGAIPLPMSDAVPITAAQIGMIISLGKIFGISLSDAAAKSIANVALIRTAGVAFFRNIIKAIPGGQLFGSFIGAATAASLTEVLGWIIAEDFFRMYNGQEPENILEAADSLKGSFEGLRISKKEE